MLTYRTAEAEESLSQITGRLQSGKLKARLQIKQPLWPGRGAERRRAAANEG